MPGFANGPTGNSIMWSDNVDFSGAVIPTETVTTNGQLIVGSTATPHLKIGTITSPFGTLAIGYSSPNITLDITGGTPAVQHLTGDTGGQLNPDGSNNFNLLGQQAGTIPVMGTIGVGSTLRFENRTWQTALVVDPSATVGLRGTYQTITAAIAAASAGQTIFVRPGTYTENFVLKASVNITAFSTDSHQASPNVSIVGKITAAASGVSVLSNLQVANSGDVLFASGGGNVLLYGCQLLIQGTSNSGISFASGSISLFNCHLTTNGISVKYFTLTSAATLFLYYCTSENSGSVAASTSANTSTVSIYHSNILYPITNSDTAQIDLQNSTFGFTSLNATYLTVGGAGATCRAISCAFISGSGSSISVGAGVTFTLSNSSVNSTNTNAITGAGIIQLSNISFTNTSSLVNTTTQTPQVSFNNAVRVTTPGAYPYTTVPQDNLILVDTSSARSIVPLASPTTGQVHRIKDSVGSAAANNITVTPSGKNIDGAASTVINVAYGSIDIIYNGAEWSIL